MIELTVLQPCTLRSGVIKLSKDQARRRLRYDRVGEVHQDSPIRPVGDKRRTSVYDIIGECHFKVGEEIALDDPPEKGLWPFLAPRGDTRSVQDVMLEDVALAVQADPPPEPE